MRAPSSGPSKPLVLPQRILELDGFRAIAVLMVMGEHMYDGWRLPASASSWMPHPLYLAVTHGWLGVDLFFVLSGFLITGILLDERHRDDYFSSFYGRRALRILPLVLVCIAIWSLAYREPFGGYFLLALIFCANLDLLLRVPSPHGPGVLWSLAVEEHFYLLWPLLVRNLKKANLVLIATAIVLLSPVARGLAVAWGMQPDNVYQLSWFRFDGLALGALMAVFVRSPYFTIRNTWAIVTGWLSLIVLLTLLLRPYGIFRPQSILGEALRYTQAQAIFACAMCLALAHCGSKWCSPLRWRFARWTAKLSYCLYLIHLSVGDLYYWALHRLSIDDARVLGGPGALFVRAAIIICVSYALAALSQRYLEAPFMRLRRYFDRPLPQAMGPAVSQL